MTIKKKAAASGQNKLTIFLMLLSTILTVWMLFDKPVSAAPVLEDTAITDAVEKELISDPAVPFGTSTGTTFGQKLILPSWIVKSKRRLEMSSSGVLSWTAMPSRCRLKTASPP